MVALLLTVESQVVFLKLEPMTIKDGKGRSLLCRHQGRYIMPAEGMYTSHKDVLAGDAICKNLWKECSCY